MCGKHRHRHKPIIPATEPRSAIARWRVALEKGGGVTPCDQRRTRLAFLSSSFSIAVALAAYAHTSIHADWARALQPPTHPPLLPFPGADRHVCKAGTPFDFALSASLCLSASRCACAHVHVTRLAYLGLRVRSSAAPLVLRLLSFAGKCTTPSRRHAGYMYLRRTIHRLSHPQATCSTLPLGDASTRLGSKEGNAIAHT